MNRLDTVLLAAILVLPTLGTAQAPPADPPRLDRLPWMAGCWEGASSVLATAHRRRYAARIGLEDTLTLPDGRLARNNAELVAAAVASLYAGGRSAAASS